jgi:hypothetical protein
MLVIQFSCMSLKILQDAEGLENVVMLRQIARMTNELLDVMHHLRPTYSSHGLVGPQARGHLYSIPTVTTSPAPSAAPTLAPATPQPPTDAHPSSTPPTTALVGGVEDPGTRRTVNLGGGPSVTFLLETLLPPPQPSYNATDIPRLVRHWDAYPLRLSEVQTADIGIRFWPEIYHKTKYWKDSFRNTWNRWKVHLGQSHSLTSKGVS